MFQVEGSLFLERTVPQTAKDTFEGVCQAAENSWPYRLNHWRTLECRHLLHHTISSVRASTLLWQSIDKKRQYNTEFKMHLRSKVSCQFSWSTSDTGTGFTRTLSGMRSRPMASKKADHATSKSSLRTWKTDSGSTWNNAYYYHKDFAICFAKTYLSYRQNASRVLTKLVHQVLDALWCTDTKLCRIKRWWIKRWWA